MNNRALIHIRILVLVLFLGLICPCAMGQEARSDFSRLSSKVIKGDADNDGFINMTDVTNIINIILHGGSTDSGDPSLPTDDPEGGDPGSGV